MTLQVKDFLSLERESHKKVLFEYRIKVFFFVDGINNVDRLKR